MIEVRDLAVRLGKTEVLRGVTLAVEDQGVFVLLGPNGSGKSTLLRAIAGLVQPYLGTVALNGRDITFAPVDDRVRMGVALAPQGRRLFSSMTVEENLLMGAYARRQSKSVLQGEISAWGEYFPKLLSIRQKLATSLSGGEQQLVAIVRALMAKPSVLLMDEPSIGVAPIVLKELHQTLLRLNQDMGLTLVVVEQNVPFALKLARTVGVMTAGRVAAVEHPESLRDRKVLADIYFGRTAAQSAASASLAH